MRLVRNYYDGIPISITNMSKEELEAEIARLEEEEKKMTGWIEPDLDPNYPK